MKKQHDKGTISKDPLEMMYKVGLDENKKLVKITKMSKKPFEITTPNLPELVANEPKGVGYIELDEDNHLLLI
ncbi:hypothetical protein OUY_00865 [Wolbachia endosymbiont of Leptopilina clavipes]|uniref:hypothetical protein n=1 Tax=Wolbachia endosymbiont of Leptopilina clavipes TaxID=260213 RepID=UPI001117C2D6|nr:hypothetical protein [Wolbachia endosymbiont of Leptopilina clavipes]TNK94557.1 hypothetical protein OUY_00865 [Wolbachia endosymbiont of Leptopilina clavipes]